jgi:hypothetical protein
MLAGMNPLQHLDSESGLGSVAQLIPYASFIQEN